jgi:hypothetical protein
MDSASLSINPGTRVDFQGHYEIDIQGVLKAIGSEDNKIHFTLMDTTNLSDMLSPEGGWEGIHFDNGSNGADGAMFDNDTSKIIYCIIEFGKTLDEVTDSFGGAIYIHHFSKLRIENCEIAHNYSHKAGGAIYCDKANPIIRGNEIHHNRTNGRGGGICCEKSDPLITDNWIHTNTCMSSGGGIDCKFSKPEMTNNIIDHNRVISGSGGGINCQTSDARIINNRLLNNTSYSGGGITISWGPAEVTNNLIANNSVHTTGGGVHIFLSDDVILINNTIVNNLAYGGGGIQGVLSTIDCYNSILWNNYSESGKQANTLTASATLNFYNCNIMEGFDELVVHSGDKWTSEYINNIDTIPDFINPTELLGTESNALEGDWSIYPTSPCINAGTADLPAYNHLPDQDLAGNERINDDLIDIGCYENRSGPPEITIHPVNHILCRGAPVTFSVATKEKANYQWQKDGIDIPGANQAEFTIDSVLPVNDGNYQCLINNQHGSIRSNSAYLLVKSPASILVEPETSWIRDGFNHSLEVTANGTLPFTYKWKKDGADIAGATSPVYTISGTDSTSEGEYVCIVSNYCSSDTTSPAYIYVAPQICMVTVDTMTGKNLVVWEKNTTAPIASYNIYRESIVAGEYEAIGNVPANELSEYSDTGANPVVRAYIYKITAVATDGEESNIELCKPHKTIHLLTSHNTEHDVAQLNWDHYYGFDYPTYFIFRKTQSDTVFRNFYAMPSSTTTWIDIGAPKDEIIYYRVGVDKPGGCTPTGGSKKAGTGPYHHILSNLDDNKKRAVGTIKELVHVDYEGLKIYPNPINSSSTIIFPNHENNNYQLVIIDLSGIVCRIIDGITTSEYFLKKGDLKQGLYFIELRGLRTYRGKIIIE